MNLFKLNTTINNDRLEYKRKQMCDEVIFKMATSACWVEIIIFGDVHQTHEH